MRGLPLWQLPWLLVIKVWLRTKMGWEQRSFAARASRAEIIQAFQGMDFFSEPIGGRQGRAALHSLRHFF